MKIKCDLNNEMKPSGFIGYKLISKGELETVRIYLNCKDESHFDGAVDVIFKGNKPKFGGLDELSTIKKFNRFIGALEERAREENVSRDQVFKSAKELLYFLSRIKNSKNFKNGKE